MTIDGHEERFLIHTRHGQGHADDVLAAPDRRLAVVPHQLDEHRLADVADSRVRIEFRLASGQISPALTEVELKSAVHESGSRQEQEWCGGGLGERDDLKQVCIKEERVRSLASIVGRDRLVHETPIGSNRWRTVLYNKDIRISTVEVEELSRLFPAYRWWLISGEVAPEIGQTNHEYDEA